MYDVTNYDVIKIILTKLRHEISALFQNIKLFEIIK